MIKLESLFAAATLPAASFMATIMVNNYFSHMHRLISLSPVLTFSQEVDHVWRRRLTLPTIAFLLLRYITPFELVFSVGKWRMEG